jgi:hypothetical protein
MERRKDEGKTGRIRRGFFFLGLPLLKAFDRWKLREVGDEKVESSG